MNASNIINCNTKFRILIILNEFKRTFVVGNIKRSFRKALINSPWSKAMALLKHFLRKLG
jgi:hypothetical protein